MGDFELGATKAPMAYRVMPLFSLKGRTAIVSGAGAGIGLSVAQALAEAGANVAIWYNSNKQAIKEAETIEETYGVKCKAYSVNVISQEAVDKAVDQAIKDLGNRLDVFVANSGIAWDGGAFIDGSMEDADKIMKINVNGTMYCAAAAGRQFRQQKKDKLDNFVSGSFIATASMSGHIVNIPQQQTIYNASKATVIHLCKSLAVEWAGFGRVNTVSPGYMDTDINSSRSKELRDTWRTKTPMGREGQPNELKGAYLYLASDASSFTTGADLVVDGGYCLP